jgi:hypothetical protein
MSRFAHLIMLVTYLLGVASIPIALLLVFAPHFMSRLFTPTPRGGLIFAIALFVCSIASSLVRTATQAKS